MIRVVVESPYSGDVGRNIAYARRAVRDCLDRGESPIASHLLFTQPGILDDRVFEERALGMAAGRAWHEAADKVAFYVDYGWSSGMLDAHRHALSAGVPWEARQIGENP